MPKLFAVMPYGIRRGPFNHDKPEETVEIDFDGVWESILKPAVPAGFETRRADELHLSGSIDRQYIKWLLEADIVLADLTFFNPNVHYELGIRHALAKIGTVLVACNNTNLPFDLRSQNVEYYDYFAAPRLPQFISQLRLAIENAARHDVDSPVHSFIPELFIKVGKDPDQQIRELTYRVKELEQEIRDRHSREEEDRFLEKIRDANSRGRVFSLYRSIASENIRSIRLLERLAIKLRDFSYFDEAIEVLERALALNPRDWELLRELGFAYRKKGPESYSMAESYMERALQLNDADAELHGMVGGLFKRRSEYNTALTHYRKAYELEPDNLYSLVTVAAISGALGFVDDAKVFYEKLQTLSERAIAQGNVDHWTYLCLGEAAAVLGHQEIALTAYRNAIALKPPIEHVRSEAEQLEFLKERQFAAQSIGNVLPILREYIKPDTNLPLGN